MVLENSGVQKLQRGKGSESMIDCVADTGIKRVLLYVLINICMILHIENYVLP